MIIGIDISSLQGPHRMRGIGFTVLNLINNIPREAGQKNKFVFFMLEDKADAALSELNLKDLDFEVRYIRSIETPSFRIAFIPARISRLLNSAIRQMRLLKEYYFGNSSIRQTADIDIFLQPDQSQSLSKCKRNAIILYDLIPYVLEKDYLWSYSTARSRGLYRLASIRCAGRRWLYLKKLRINVKRADVLLPISESTKKDFLRYTAAKPNKFKLLHLGVVPSTDYNGSKKKVELTRYVKTSWGYLPKPYDVSQDTPFLLYVGGADRRRKLNELATAFNHLRGQGLDIKLVLTGDSMQGPENISTEEIQYELKKSSYLEDMIFMGFVSDDIREWLYHNALAFIYPSVYEGFGLPVLEAMSHGTPVITYRNSSIPEIAGDAVIYAEGHQGIVDSVRELVSSKTLRLKYRDMGLNQAAKYSWEKTSKELFKLLD